MVFGSSINPAIFFGRTMVFIDGESFFEGCKANGRKIDNVNFSLMLHQMKSSSRHIVRACYYSAPAANANDPRHKLQDKLRKEQLFEVILGGAVGVHGQLRQKGVDVRLGVDMVRHAANHVFDVAVLVAGDEDFVPAVKAVKDFGRQVELIYFEDRTSDRLIESADIRRPINDWIWSQWVPSGTK